MKTEKHLLGAFELLEIAARVENLMLEASQESLAYRIAGRLARDPHDVWASSESTVAFAKGEDAISSAFTLAVTEVSIARLPCAMLDVSMHRWEELWNKAHPDRFGQAWDGEDFALMAVWRDTVRAMIKDCHQEALLTMTAEDYFAQLIEAGVSEEVAQALADWLSLIQGETTPLLK